jgi:hypothetical protein
LRRRGRRVTTLLSTGARGANAVRGRSSSRRAARRRADCRPPVSSRRTTSRCSTRSARVNDRAEPSIDRIGPVIANGGLATTRNGRAGGRNARTSASTTTTSRPASCRRRSAERRACISTAITRAPASSSGRVKLPVPAPRSITSSPGRTSAAATTSSAQPGSRRCHPHDRRPDTAHCAERDHQARLVRQVQPTNAFCLDGPTESAVQG